MKDVFEIEKDSRGLTHERIIFLDGLRAIAIIMVVGVHTRSYCIPLPNNIEELISFIVCTVSVPVFFLVDGYLFARNTTLSKEFSYLENVQKSSFRLLIPWAIFTVLYTIARYCFEITGFLKEKMIIGHSLQEVTILAYGSVYAPQMYFLASLFLIRLCSPIFKRIAFMKSLFCILLLFLCYYAVYNSCIPFISSYLRIDDGQEPILHAMWGIQFYLIGIILFKTSNILELKKLFVPFLTLFLVTLLIPNEIWTFRGALIQYFYLITLFLLFVFFGNRLPFLDMIGKNTMGIYLIHAPIVLKGVSLILNKFITVPIWSFISVLFCSFFLSVGVVIAINYIPYGALIFGKPYQKNKRVWAKNGRQ